MGKIFYYGGNIAFGLLKKIGKIHRIITMKYEYFLSRKSPNIEMRSAVKTHSN